MEIRKAVPGDEAGIAFVQVESWRSTYKGIVEDQYLDQMSTEDRQKMWRGIIENPIQEREVYVASINQEIVGFCAGGPNRSLRFPYKVELYAIYLLQEYQRRGIGSSLIRRLAQSFHESGFYSMLVWSLQQNPSKMAYERLGAIKLGEEEIQIGEQVFMEDALGFDFRRLLQL